MNKRIIGILGSGEENSNSNQDAKVISYSFYPFQINALTKQRIEIRGSDLSSRIYSDDYILHEIKLQGIVHSNFALNEHYGVFKDIERAVSDVETYRSRLLEEKKIESINGFNHPWLLKSKQDWPELKARTFSLFL